MRFTLAKACTCWTLQVLTRIAGCVWKRWLLCASEHGTAAHTPTDWQTSIQETSKVALGQAASSELLADAARGNATALRILHNTCTSLMWRALNLLQKDNCPSWSLSGCLIALAELFKGGFLSPLFGLDCVTSMIKALDCSKQVCCSTPRFSSQI
jgi:hypothetical protein